jgi:hypothetical protein
MLSSENLLTSAISQVYNQCNNIHNTIRKLAKTVIEGYVKELDATDAQRWLA